VILKKSLARSFFVPILFVSFISTIIFSGCNPSRQTPSTSTNKDVLKLLYWQAPTILNPHLSNGSKDIEASRVTLEPLASFDSNENLIPFLAAEVPTLENGSIAKDGKSVTWKLKQGIKWSDDTPFTAADVEFTYQYISNPKVGSVSAGNYKLVESVQAIDDYTVKVNFKKPNAAWFIPFVGPEGLILPKHIFEQYNGSNSREAPANLKAIGTGPYRVVEFKPGDIVVYEANPYFRQAQDLGFKRVELKGGGDATSAARAVLQTGDADYGNNLQVEAQVLKELESGGKGKILSSLAPWLEHILFNLTDPNKATPDGERSSIRFPHPFFSDAKVRQAFSLAIDRDTIVKQLYGLTGKTTANILVGPSQYYSPNTTYKFNPNKAASLLDEAGWKDTNGNGIRDKNGIEMQVVFQTSVNPLRQKVQIAAKQTLQSIGVGVELKSIDPSVFFSSDPASNDTVEHFYADLQMFTREINNPDPSDYMKVYTCEEIPQKANNWTGTNDARYCNPDYDALWKKVTTELDPEKRKQLFIEMNDLLVNDMVAIPVVHRARVVGTSNSLKGVDLTPWDMGTWKIMDWKRP
jgi:peptide/nickel transport system substrate-binding protein